MTTTTVDTDQFLKLLGKSGLVPPEVVNSMAVKENLLGQPPIDVAKYLVAQGTITPFQGRQLLKNHWRGLVIDGYRILEPLGAGGMGWVYLGQEIDGGWKVAIKVLSEACRRQEGMLARFQLEAQAGMTLKHPNILRTEKIGAAEDRYGTIHYVAMEFVQGINLNELLGMRSISWQQACDIVRQTANGLHFAHEAGMIHRDVKPENLLIRANGTAKLLDFGLAMVDDNDEEFSMAMIHGQDRLGTADYVSPEQSINSYDVDRRTDIYSLGCTLYVALTRHLPFPTRSIAEKIQGHRKLQARRVREINPDVPERLELIVRKMMAKNPDNRIATAEEVAKHLEPYAERKPVEFNFAALLKLRKDVAKRRSRIRAQNSGTMSADSDARASSFAGELRQSNVETIVREGTQITDQNDDETQQS